MAWMGHDKAHQLATLMLRMLPESRGLLPVARSALWMSAKATGNAVHLLRKVASRLMQADRRALRSCFEQCMHCCTCGCDQKRAMGVANKLLPEALQQMLAE